jgi:murein DD-endopeptidase MepM/ murein hydrolase activator NlpD
LRISAAAAVAGASLSVGAGLAFGAGGGVTPPSPPGVTDVTCLSTCGGVRKATTSSKVSLSGHHLAGVTKVSFSAKSGPRIAVDPTAVTRHSVSANVPDGAATGRPKVVDSMGGSSKSPATLRIIPAGKIPSSGNFKLRDVSASPHKAYYDGKRKATVRYTFTNNEPTDVRIDVVQRGGGGLVASWVQRNQEPNTVHTATWNGTQNAAKRRRPAPNGRYRFRIGPLSGTMDSTSDAKFQYHQFIFPVHGAHSYGDGVGAPRAGHIHEGQDVMADCGTKLLAVRGGRVQWRASQASAGNYVVIDGKGTRHDWMYAHLKKRSPLHRGEKVKTGEKIGIVGQTGDATACHLHIEEWGPPGWYEGGHFLRSITRHLKQWDKWS